ncbi:DnaD domain protein [Staphylococcus equorum]|uniref:DnaD domain-containing protein n=1 Tax=Staphylococcus equorum TaxID=246432 RepID=UPI003D80496C
MIGWIKVHRSLREHWLYEEERKFSCFEAWLDILLMVNHEDKKVLLGKELILVKRGQKIISIRKLCERWSWSNNKVKKYLKTLESDGMLIAKSDTKKTLLTVVNYEFYQSRDSENRRKCITNASQKHHRSDTDASQKHTNKNEKNVKNEKNEKKQPQLDMSNNNGSIGDDDTYSNPTHVLAFEFFQQNGFGMLNPYISGQINSWMAEFPSDGDEILVKAMQEAVNNNVKRWNYVNGILKRWLNSGAKTLADVEALMVAHNSKNKQKQSSESPYVKIIEEARNGQ